MVEIDPAAHHRAVVMDAIFQNFRPRTPGNGSLRRKTTEQVPILAIAKRLIETAGAQELRVPDQHDAAVDDEIAGEQIAQDFAARLAPPTQQAASPDAASTRVDPVIISVDRDAIGRNVFEKPVGRTGNQAIVGIEKNHPAIFTPLRGHLAFDFREPEIAGGGDASAVALDQGHPLVGDASRNLSRAIGRPIVDDDHPFDVGLAQRACNGFRNESGAVFDRDNDVDPHSYLLLSRKRRDVPERNTRERGLKQFSNVRASGELRSMLQLHFELTWLNEVCGAVGAVLISRNNRRCGLHAHHG
ncbi:hypothetical protein [Bradyrhizobium sp. S69]|uniref:hypothetical protein n=1 Tax=Bradyrhizobium sp. S69 TaxID=1641856 RepID=UPI001FEF839C|nr:hypothetical protein [Bradyrhizobium sp. S69]